MYSSYQDKDNLLVYQAMCVPYGRFLRKKLNVGYVKFGSVVLRSVAAASCLRSQPVSRLHYGKRICTMEEFGNWKIVPDVIDKAPPARADVVWSDSGVQAEMGEMLTPTQVKERPKVTFPHEEGALYTIIMTDPDAPKSKAEVLHWSAINVKDGDSETGQNHAEYFGSGPPKGTGIHRYIFLIYKQPQNYTPNEAYRPRNRERRYLWSVRKFAKENNLGDPVAGNFYRAEFDSYVPTLHAELDAATPKE